MAFERTAVTPTDWSLGIEARVRAFLSDGRAAERLYRESIDRPGHDWPSELSTGGFERGLAGLTMAEEAGADRQAEATVQLGAAA